MEISVLSNFSEFPGLRHCNISEQSGEEFYHAVLNNAFKEAFERNETLTVNLDHTAGYASSFLDEAFGNLTYDFSLEAVRPRVNIISLEEPHWKDMIEKETFSQWEERRARKKNPKVTKPHEAWWRLDNGQLKSDVWEQPAQ
jgi:hypothetical protein